MNNSSDNPRRDSSNISDDQLDVLLRLATPTIQPAMQQRLQRQLDHDLLDSRPAVLKLNRSTRRHRLLVTCLKPIAAVAAAVLALLLWLNEHTPDMPTSSSDFPIQVSVNLAAAPDAEIPDSILDSHKPETETQVKTGISSIPIQKNNNQTLLSQQRTVHRSRTLRLNHYPRQRIGVIDRWMQTDTLSRITHETSDTMMTSLAKTHTGLRMLESVLVQFDRVAYLQRQSFQSPQRYPGCSQRQRRESEVQLMHLIAARGYWESELVRQIQNGSSAEALTAFRLLCRIGTTSSLPIVLNYRDHPLVQADVAAAVCRLGTSQLIGDLIVSTDDPSAKRALMAQLLQRGDTDSVHLFLTLTEKHRLHGLAQQVGEQIPGHRFPTATLLEQLNSNRLSIARAAAMTLSLRNDQQISVYLAELLQYPVTRSAGIMALTVRQDALSADLVNRLSQDTRWIATIDTAQKKWNRLLAAN